MQDLESVSGLVKYAENLSQEIEELDKVWKEKTKLLRELLEQHLPMAMDELGLTKVETEEFTITVGDDWRASISQAKMPDVVAYADELNLSELADYKIEMTFGRDEQDMFNQALLILNREQQPYTKSRKINTATWKAAIKEAVDKGEKIDLVRACATQTRAATIKTQKQTIKRKPSK